MKIKEYLDGAISDTKLSIDKVEKKIDKMSPQSTRYDEWAKSLNCLERLNERLNVLYEMRGTSFD